MQGKDGREGENIYMHACVYVCVSRRVRARACMCVG